MRVSHHKRRAYMSTLLLVYFLFFLACAYLPQWMRAPFPPEGPLTLSLLAGLILIPSNIVITAIFGRVTSRGGQNQ